MSDDRELLELAARAYADELIKPDQFGDYYRHVGWDENLGCAVLVDWNPLTDDGDALRLAVKLQMTLSLGPCEVSASTIDGVLNNRWFKHEIIHTEARAATRRAIVRAAADLARG